MLLTIHGTLDFPSRLRSLPYITPHGLECVDVVPVAETSLLDRRDVPGRYAAYLPAGDNPALFDKPRQLFRRRNLLREGKQVKKGAAVHHVDAALLQPRPYLALPGPLEYVGNDEFGPQRLAVAEELEAELHQGARDVQAGQPVGGDAVVHQLPQVLPEAAADVQVGRRRARGLEALDDGVIGRMREQGEVREAVQPDTRVGVGREAPLSLEFSH